MRVESGTEEFKALRDQGKIIRVFLDGVDISKRCIMADEEAGVIERCILNEHGAMQVDPNDPERVWTEEVRGNVRIEISDEEVT